VSPLATPLVDGSNGGSDSEDDRELDETSPMPKPAAAELLPGFTMHPHASSPTVSLPAFSASSLPPFPPCRPLELYTALYPHQRTALPFLAQSHGVILGDDMGLGKTFSSITYILSVFYSTYVAYGTRSKHVNPDLIEQQYRQGKFNALVVLPPTLLDTWTREYHRIIDMFPLSFKTSITIDTVTSSISKSKREKIIGRQLRFQKQLSDGDCDYGDPVFGITFSTYGMVQTGILDPSSYKVVTAAGADDDSFAGSNACADDDDEYWSMLAFDESHQLKTPSTQTYVQSLALSPFDPDNIENYRTKRLLLTGTPVQNNLMELHAVVSMALGPVILGDKKLFKKSFSDPIELGRSITATKRQVEVSRNKSVHLQAVLEPYFLRRLKDDIFKESLPPKRELVIWTHISDLQRTEYRRFLESQTVVDLVNGNVKKSPLLQVTWLKTLVAHPILVKIRNDVETADDVIVDDDGVTSAIKTCSIDQLVQNSSKLMVLRDLVTKLLKGKHKILVFSTSTKMLDIIQRVLLDINLSICRIDGSTKQKDRGTVVDSFNNDETIQVMLLSTKVGGLGLTLTSADRAVIYDPSWNPADDSQAVDRCYRIGQTKPVTVYRLVAAGTVEERMYEKQVHKVGIKNQVLEGGGETRYFDNNDLSKLFSLGERGECRLITRDKEEEAAKKKEAAASAAVAAAATTTAMKKSTTLGKYGAAFSPGFGTGSTKFRTGKAATPPPPPAGHLPPRPPTSASPRVAQNSSSKLSAVKAILTPKGAGATGKATFLLRHVEVVGVTAHDQMYNDGGDDDGCGGEGGKTPGPKATPFKEKTVGSSAGVAPTRLMYDDDEIEADNQKKAAAAGKQGGAATGDGDHHAVDTTTVPFGNLMKTAGGERTMNKSRREAQRAKEKAAKEKAAKESKNDENRSPGLPDVINLCLDDSSDEEKAKKDARKAKRRDARKEKEKEKEKEEEAEVLFKEYKAKGEKMEAEGDGLNALEEYMSAIEIATADKDGKMDVHRRIAKIGDDLGWLHE
jgi:superfamily II DNA/RNA helicase